MVVKKQMQLNKKPKLLGTWIAKNNKTISAMQVYGDNIYVIDSQNNQICRYSKLSGAPNGLFLAPNNTLSAAEMKDGTVYVVTRDGKVLRYKGEKLAGEVKELKDVKRPVWMLTDSADNIYVVDAEKNVVSKYDNAFNKIGDIGNKGNDEEKINGVGRIYLGPSDSIYALDAGAGGKSYLVKIFDSKGKFENTWKIQNIKKLSGLEALAITQEGDVYINDFNASQVLAYDKKGNTKCIFYTDKTGAVKVTYPGFIAGGLDGTIEVASSNMYVFESIK
jgi:hypothetical protein